ncbi:MAG: endolytic transglycosylase MltG, partial [Clostridium sp.]
MNILKNKKVIVFLFILILAIISYLLFNRTIKHPLKVNEDIVVTVENGDNFYSILNTLSENNQIKSLKIIKTYVKTTNKVVDVKPGEYKLHNNMSVNDIINVLNSEN